MVVPKQHITSFLSMRRMEVRSAIMDSSKRSHKHAIGANAQRRALVPLDHGANVPNLALVVRGPALSWYSRKLRLVGRLVLIQLVTLTQKLATSMIVLTAMSAHP